MNVSCNRFVRFNYIINKILDEKKKKKKKVVALLFIPYSLSRNWENLKQPGRERVRCSVNLNQNMSPCIEEITIHKYSYFQFLFVKNSSFFYILLEEGTSSSTDKSLQLPILVV